MKLFLPILAGASLRDRLFACVGAIAGIGLTALITTLVLGHDFHLPFIVAPMGASAVLLFAVPASPLAQPWPIIGGNTISALVGVVIARLVPDPMVAVGLAVGLAILVMSLTRSLHPPGGAAALTAVAGGPTVLASGFLFPFVPVALNAILLVGIGWLFHRISRHSYPHVPPPAPSNVHNTLDPPAALRVGFTMEDVDGALSDLGETFDIDRDDLDRVLRQVERRALMRTHAEPTCADIMSRDVIKIDRDAEVSSARDLLLAHGIRTLPVHDGEGRLMGTVGLREVLGTIGKVGEVMRPATIAHPETSAVTLVEPLTDGRTHAVVITDAQNGIVGLVTQTDLLAAVTRQRLLTMRTKEAPTS